MRCDALYPHTVMYVDPNTGYTQAWIVYDAPAAAFGLGIETPALAVPPASAIAVEDSSRSGPDAPYVTAPVYVPFAPLPEESKAVGPDVSSSL